MCRQIEEWGLGISIIRKWEWKENKARMGVWYDVLDSKYILNNEI